MSAYVIVEVLVKDPEEYKSYTKLTPATIKSYGGKFIVRGGKTEAIEGNWQPNRLVILEFPSIARAKEWWNSPEYTEAKKIRHRTAETKMLLVEGFEES